MSSQQRTRTGIYSVQRHGAVLLIEILQRALCEGEGALFRQAYHSQREDERKVVSREPESAHQLVGRAEVRLITVSEGSYTYVKQRPNPPNSAGIGP